MQDPRAELNDPNTPAARLAELAQQHPEFGAAISAHPNVYPELQGWIAQYVLPTVPQQPLAAPAEVAAPVDPAALAPAQYAVPQDHAAPAAHASELTQQPQTPGGKKGAILIILAAVLVFVLALGGGLWWFFASKLGGSSSPAAATEKLLHGAADLDPLALYGSFAPSEFSSFETASQNLLDTRSDADSKNAEQFLDDLKRELAIDETERVEFSEQELVEGSVARVTAERGVLEISGDPDTIADVIMDFYGPIAEAQSEAYGYELDTNGLRDMREGIARSLGETLPYELDFAELELSVVTVKEGNGWYVSPILTLADLVHRDSGASDRLLGDEIVEPASDGSQHPAEAAERLAHTIADGDVDAIVEQMPVPERRLLSIYGPSLGDSLGIDPGSLRDAIDDGSFSLDEARFAEYIDGDIARLSIDRLAFSTRQFDEWSGAELQQDIEITGSCVAVEGERLEYIDYYAEEYDPLWEEWFSDRSFPGTFDDWLELQGFELYEITDTSEEHCLADELPALKRLGVEDWSLVAVKEDGNWMVSPLATIADIAAISTGRVSDAAKEGRLDTLFEE